MRNRNRNHTPPDPGPAPGATWRSYVAEVPAWVIVLGTISVSFWTQVFAVGQHDFAYWESLIVAGSTDAGTLGFLFMAREDTFKGRRTWGAWTGSIACAAASVQWNVVTDWAKGDFLGVEFHLWMPVLALGTWYWLLHGRKRKVGRTPPPIPDPEPPSPLTRADLFPPPVPDPPAAAPLPEVAIVEALPPAAESRNGTSGRGTTTLAKATLAYRKLARTGPVTGSRLGGALGVSAVMGRKWKKRVERNRPFRIERGVAA